SKGPPVTAPPAAVPSNGPAAGSAGSSALTLDGPSEVKVGEEFQVSVRLSTDESITHLLSQLRFEPGAFQIVSAETGDMVPAAAGSPKVQTRSGGAQLDVRTTSEEPVQGSGNLMILRLKALAPRNATEIAAMLNVLGAANATVGNSPAPPLKIAIQPAGK
ncbi:MAG: cohesin domain-containing protein, partial [Steroidobacteraceae bacterium]